MTMVVIGYDRYNVIVCGFKGAKINAPKALGILFLVWTYGVLGCCPPFWGWGGYALGNKTSKNLCKTPQCLLFFVRRRSVLNL